MHKFILVDNSLVSVASHIDINAYALEIGGIVIDESHPFVVKIRKIALIDSDLDDLAKDLLHNETYQGTVDYQSTKSDILIKMQNLRDDRKVVLNEK